MLQNIITHNADETQEQFNISLKTIVWYIWPNPNELQSQSTGTDIKYYDNHKGYPQ